MCVKMFPKRLLVEYAPDFATEINVERALRKQIPYFLNWLEEGARDMGEVAKFTMDRVVKVEAMTCDTHVDTMHDIDVWGVGLRVWLQSGKYFLLYIPLYYEDIMDEVFSYWEEVYESIQVVPGDTDVFALPQMSAWRSNLFLYTHGCETFVMEF